MAASADSDPWSLDTASTVPLWIDRLDPPVAHRPGLDGDLDVDVAIVGGGFSGLWTDYYLKRLEPALRVAVLERHHCGFGASGRNGGWAVGELAGSASDYARRSSPGESRRLVRAVFDAVDEIGRVATAEQIDCDYAKGGTVRLARTRPQAERQAAEIGEARSFGLTEDEIRLLDADEAREQLNATEVRSGILLGPSAVVDPAKLALGLACAAEASGVEIYEQTRATRIGGGAVQIAAEGARGSPVGRGRCEVRAPVIVRATEAYTRDLRGQRRDILPVYSRMIATEPLPDEIFDDIGLASRPSFADDRRMVTYGQRTLVLKYIARAMVTPWRSPPESSSTGVEGERRWRPTSRSASIASRPILRKSMLPMRPMRAVMGSRPMKMLRSMESVGASALYW